MPAARNIAFLASETDLAEEAKARLEEMYGRYAPEEADVIVALGGDGFMLSTLHATQEIDAPVYGMNRGTVGFLMNAYREDDLIARLEAAEEEVINPLHMWAERVDGSTHEALAINEVSLLRAGPQAAKLRIYVDGRLRMEELVCDGALVCTPAGSTAYNYSAHGPILPIGADVLAVTDPEVAAALRFIRRNPTFPVQVDDVVEATNVSRRVLEKRFRAVLRHSIYQEIRRFRVNSITQLLVGTDMSITDIATRSGFDGVEHIARYFRKEVGLSLRDYRKKYAPR